VPQRIKGMPTGFHESKEDTDEKRNILNRNMLGKAIFIIQRHDPAERDPLPPRSFRRQNPPFDKPPIFV
jgi:hypothetical protein